MTARVLPDVWIERVLKSGEDWFIVFAATRGPINERRDALLLGEGPTPKDAHMNALSCARNIADQVAALEMSRLCFGTEP